MKTSLCLFCMFVLLAVPALGQKKSPTDAAMSFYSSLRARQYVEGFRFSVYRGAVDGLSADDLKDLEPDFTRTFSQIPGKIEAKGEQISGDTATVFLKFEGTEEVQPVALIRVGGEWLVGDQEAFQVVKQQGRAFFFNMRMLVNEVETYDNLQRLIGAEVIYSQKFDGRCASLEEIIKRGGLPADVNAGGYTLALELSQDQKSFYATATPKVYGRTGKLSFYADINGIRAEDLKGKVASAKSPVYVPK